LWAVTAFLQSWGEAARVGGSRRSVTVMIRL
jgi:hypothetical protein